MNDDHTANSQFMQAIALDQTTGAVALSWYDARNDRGTGGSGDTNGVPNDDAQIWATYSMNGGATFAPNFRVSRGTSNASDAQSGFDYGDYTHAAFQFRDVFPGLVGQLELRRRQPGRHAAQARPTPRASPSRSARAHPFV